MQDLDADLEDDENYNAEELKKLEVYKCRQVTPYKQRTNTATLGRLESKINKIKQEEKIKKKKVHDSGEVIKSTFDMEQYDNGECRHIICH